MVQICGGGRQASYRMGRGEGGMAALFTVSQLAGPDGYHYLLLVSVIRVRGFVRPYEMLQCYSTEHLAYKRF
jgi:hypothetical protein